MNMPNFKINLILKWMKQGARPVQEDFVLFDKDKNSVMVADGFGGPISGVQASRIACESIRSFLFKEAGDIESTMPFVLKSYFSLSGNVLFNALIFANRKLITLNQGKSIHACGGASVIAGYIDGDLLAIANVGVCTSWLFRRDQFIELVTPRSYEWLCNPFKGQSLEKKKIPLIALGLVSDLEPEIIEIKLIAGDWILFATDAVTDLVIQEIFKLKQKNVLLSSIESNVLDILQKMEFSDNLCLSLLVC